MLVATVAEILGIDPLDIRCVTGDTDLTPVDLGSYSSRVTLMMGNAAIQAAQRARDLIAQAAAQKFGADAGAIEFSGGRVFNTGRPEQEMPFQEAVVCAEEIYGSLGTTGSYTPAPPPGKYKGGGVGPSPAYSYTAAVVEVEVDTASGWITVPRVWIAHDLGRTMNPVLARGQVEGSVLHGTGRGADGGVRVPQVAGAPVRRAGPSRAFHAGIQESHLHGHAGSDYGSH